MMKICWGASTYSMPPCHMCCERTGYSSTVAPWLQIIAAASLTVYQGGRIHSCLYRLLWFTAGGRGEVRQRRRIMAHFRYSPLLLKESCKDIYKLHCAYIKQKCWSFNRQGHLSKSRLSLACLQNITLTLCKHPPIKIIILIARLFRGFPSPPQHLVKIWGKCWLSGSCSGG